MRTKGLAVIVAFMVLIVSVPVAFAGERYEDMTYKLGRGLTNIVTGFLELPTSIDSNLDESGIYKGTFFGLFEGLIKTIVRVGAGVYETITFPLEYPADYKPLVEPEFIYVKKHFAQNY